MDKKPYGKYLDAVGNIGVNPPLCVVCKVWVTISYHFQAIIFTIFHMKVKMKAGATRMES